MKSGKNPGLITGQYIICLLMTMAFTLSVTDLSSQDMPKPSRQSSLEAYSKGDYELAYREFSELLVTYPRDPVYKYYSGVCLVRLNREPEQAVTLLKQAQQGSAVVRTIPSDALYWLARAQQMSGKFTEAISSYNYFTELNGKKISRDLGIPELLHQCEHNEGRLTDQLPEVAPVAGEEKQEIPKEGKKIILSDEKPGATLPLNDSVSSDYEKILSEALELQYKADSLYRIAEEQKKGLEKGSYAERTKLKASITETENLAASFQREADDRYNAAQEEMNKKPFTAEYITVTSGKDRAAYVEELPDTLAENSGLGTIKDTLLVSRDTIRQEVVIKPSEIKPPGDTVAAVTVKTPAEPESVEVYSVFEVRDKAPDEKILINPSLPQGLIYRIQVAVFRNPVSYSYFKGIVPVNGFKIAGKDLTVYYAGMFRKLADANKALATVRKLGFKDAFVAALFAGKAVTSEKAAALEKEWSKKPVTSVVVRQVPADTVPPTLTFRVEVIRSLKPVRDDVLEGINRLAGTRGLEIVTLADKTMVYLIGTFITYESAVEYADLLIRNGYDSAKVGAWLGKKEIPVETARELFERLE